MTASTRLWGRFRDEVKSVSDRTRRGARRAFESGVIKVDLLSLRRERGRALADLGERILTLWNRGMLAGLESDPETLRLRARVAGVDAAIASKEAEYRRLRTSTDEAPAAPTPPVATPES